MPLLDHFHPPLSERRHWHSFHNSWATYLSSQLNSLLPAGYFAEANVQFGIEIDVATFEEPRSPDAPGVRTCAVWVGQPGGPARRGQPAGCVAGGVGAGTAAADAPAVAA